MVRYPLALCWQKWRRVRSWEHQYENTTPTSTQPAWSSPPSPSNERIRIRKQGSLTESKGNQEPAYLVAKWRGEGAMLNLLPKVNGSLPGKRISQMATYVHLGTLTWFPKHKESAISSFSNETKKSTRRNCNTAKLF